MLFRSVDSALLRQRGAVAAAMDALLAVFGQTQPRAKWRLCKIRRAFGEASDWYREYVQFELGRGSLERENQMTLIALGNELFTKLVAEVIFPGLKSVVQRTCPVLESVSRIPRLATITPLADAFVGHSPQPVCKLSPVAAFVWATIAHGTPQDQILDVARHYAHPRGAATSEINASTVVAVVRLLTERNLLTH